MKHRTVAINVAYGIRVRQSRQATTTIVQTIQVRLKKIQKPQLQTNPF